MKIRNTILFALILGILLSVSPSAHAAGYRLAEENCGSEKIVYFYNPRGTLAREIHYSDGEKRYQIEYTYSRKDRLLEKRVKLDFVTLSFHYDIKGTQIELANEAVGGDVAWSSGERANAEADRKGNVTTLTIVGGTPGTARLFYYTYDKSGRIKTFEISGYRRDNFDYGKKGELTRTSFYLNDYSSSITERRDSDGRLIESVDVYGNSITYTYDVNGREEAKYVNGDLEYSCTYDYDANGNVSRMTRRRPDGMIFVTEYRYEKTP